jgi:phage host-nuclease inhibitor protein Gam
MKSKLKTLEDVEKAVREILEYKIFLTAKTAEANDAVSKAMTPFESIIRGAKDTVENLTESVYEYLEENKKEFEVPPRSIKLAAGTIGFRLGKEHLKPLSKWTWAKVLEALVEKKEKDYLRPSTEVNRERLLEDSKKIGKAGLKEFGLRVEQVDNPFVDVNMEVPEH